MFKKYLLCTKRTILIIKYFKNYFLINDIYYIMFGAERQTAQPKGSAEVENLEAKPLDNIYYTEYSFLTIKNPSNNLDKEELVRVVYHLRNIVGFSKIHCMWYETGKQDQQHIHVIIKKRFPKEENDLKKMYKTFKQRKLRYYKYYALTESMNVSRLGDLVEYEIDTNKVTFMLSRFENQAHLYEVLYEYRFKEISGLADFID